MDTYAQIKSDRIAAMKAGENLRKEALALILAAIKQVEVDTRKELSEDDVIQILTKMVKQRQESITQFNKAGRTDLAVKESYELSVIEEYLPEQLSDEEVVLIINAALEETGVSSIKEIGKVMGVVRPQLYGKADMGKVSSIIKERLS